MRRQQMGAAWMEQQKRQQAQTRGQQVGADWLKRQSAGQLQQQEWTPPPTYAAEQSPSCLARLAKGFLYLLLVTVVLVVAYVCLSLALGGSF